MAKPTAEELAALKAKYPSAQALAVTVEGATLDIIARKPTRAEYRRFREQLLREETRAAAHESLMPCIVWPDAAQLTVILDEYGALEVSLGNMLLKLIGNEATIEKKDS